MKTICLFLVSLCALAETPHQNPNFDKMKADAKANRSPKIGVRLMAAGLEVVYNTTDPERFEQVYQAIRLAQKGAKKQKLWTTFPKMDKTYKKNHQLARQDEFINHVISLNAGLTDALNTDDPEQRRQNLHPLYASAPTHPPILVAIIETEWALGNEKVGDTLLAQLLNMEAMEAYWPLAILNAKHIRRTQGIDKGLIALEHALDLRWIRANPASELEAAWKKEISTTTNPQKLFEMGAYDKLETKAKTGQPEAAYYMAKLEFEERTTPGSKSGTAYSWIKKALAKEPGNTTYFHLASQIYVATYNAYPKKLLKKATALSKDNPDNADLIMWLAASKKMKAPQKDALFEKAFEMDPQNERAFRALWTRHRTNGDQAAIMALHETRINHTPSLENRLLYLTWLIENNHDTKAFPMLQAMLESNPENLPLYKRGVTLLPRIEGEAAYKGYFAALMVQRIDDLAEAFDLETAGELAGMLVTLFPERPEVNVLAGNLYVTANRAASSLDYYQAALVQHPNKAYLHQMIGDGWLAKDKNKKALAAYKEAIKLDPERTSYLEPNIKLAKKRINQKIKQGFAFVAAAGALAAGGSPFFNPSHGNTSKVARIIDARTAFKGSWWGGTSNQDGYGVPETRELLTEFYNHILDLEAQYHDQLEAM